MALWRGRRRTHERSTDEFLEAESPRLDYDTEHLHLVWLQAWYMSNCDGDWEHSSGVSIDTLDNPGWILTVDLAGTPLSGRRFERVSIEREEQDWVHAWVEGDAFNAACGPLNLGEAVYLFRAWAQSAVD